jgi:hypothetical protein
MHVLTSSYRSGAFIEVISTALQLTVLIRFELV